MDTYKRADGSNANWMLIDMMRGFGAHGSSSMLSLHPNTSDAELLGEGVEPTTTGFRITDDDGKIGANAKYVYVAIRRPHKPVSEFAATDLFDPQTYTSNGSTRVFTGLSTTPDMTINLSLVTSTGIPMRSTTGYEEAGESIYKRCRCRIWRRVSGNAI